ncbi:hypothetical protein CM15mP43_13070 [bacterium]|nr:MAG: hypothetical protein CM15mP43_13070 [bacterium]
MKIFVIILLFLNVIFPQTVNVSVDKQVMQEGDVLQLMIEVSGARDFPKIEMDKIKKILSLLESLRTD